ncbi:unnamed protein product [Owenia fusiformis]|uniref:Uncharacterized protein n=1 Tax=Owenia fusiformis TaxID=6347 RepID=A0A8J1TBY4_OWEFU|nr:unnamed protein product [Owenia fusiformis]
MTAFVYACFVLLGVETLGNQGSKISVVKRDVENKNDPMYIVPKYERRKIELNNIKQHINKYDTDQLLEHLSNLVPDLQAFLTLELPPKYRNKTLNAISTLESIQLLKEPFARFIKTLTRQMEILVRRDEEEGIHELIKTLKTCMVNRLYYGIGDLGVSITTSMELMEELGIVNKTDATDDNGERLNIAITKTYYNLMRWRKRLNTIKTRVNGIHLTAPPRFLCPSRRVAAKQLMPPIPKNGRRLQADICKLMYSFQCIPGYKRIGRSFIDLTMEPTPDEIDEPTQCIPTALRSWPLNIRVGGRNLAENKETSVDVRNVNLDDTQFTDGISGEKNGAVKLNYLEIPNDGDLSFKSYFTWMAYINPTTSGDVKILKYTVQGIDKLWIAIKDSKLEVGLVATNRKTFSLLSTREIPTNTWTHIAFAFNRRVLTQFINGEEFTSNYIGSVSAALSSTDISLGDQGNFFGVTCLRVYGASLDKDGIEKPMDLCKQASLLHLRRQDHSANDVDGKSAREVQIYQAISFQDIADVGDKADGTMGSKNKISNTFVGPQITWLGKVYTDDIDATLPLIDFSNDLEFGFHIWLLVGGGLIVRVKHSAVADDNDDFTMNVNASLITESTWTHIGFTYDGNTGEAFLYIDGEDVESTPLSKMDVVIDAQQGYVGKSGRRDLSFNGNISCSAVYDIVLSQTEVELMSKQCQEGAEKIQFDEEFLNCGPPIPLKNGSVSVDGTYYNAVANYSCDIGFILSAFSASTCQWDGTWNAKDTKCVPAECPSLEEDPELEVVFSNDNIHGSVASFSCRSPCDGIVGPNEIKCLQTVPGEGGVWNSSIPTCSLISCGVPPEPPHSTAVYDETTCGKTMTYVCDNCYSLKGPTFSTCQSSGEWTDTTTCELIECNTIPVAPLNGFINMDNNKCGTIATFTCSDCYDAIGSQTTTCQSNGQWSDAEPVCRIKTCPGVNSGSFNNGQINTTSNTCGTTATFTCDPCFDLVGESSRTCQSDREWSSPAPVCIVKSCGIPSEPIHSSVAYEDTTCGETVSYRCDDCYSLKGPTFSTCEINGEWSDAPICELIACGEPPEPANSTAVYDATTCGETATYACEDCYLLEGPTFSTCESNGEWTETPICKLKECKNVPEAPADGFIDVSGKTCGTVARFSCSDCFVLVGSPTTTCESSGQWSHENPICQVKTCPDISDPFENGEVDTTSNTCGTTATYKCGDCFDLVGESIRTCWNDGEWSAPEPVCVVKTCENEKPPNHGSVDTKSTTCGTIATFSCGKCHDLIGNPTRTCLSDRRWSDEKPECKVRECPKITPPEGGLFDSKHTKCGTVLTVICKECFRLIGVKTKTCLPDRTWSLGGHACRRVVCARRDVPQNAIVKQGDPTQITCGTEITFECPPAYDMKGSAVTKCLGHGQWSALLPECRVRVCPARNIVDHSKLIDTKRAERPFRVMNPIKDEVEDVITYECDQCYRMVGTPVVECKLDGTWSAFPNCKRITCKHRTVPQNAILRRGDPSVDIFCKSKVSYACPPGYDLLGSATMECLETGKWDEDSPECRIRVCPALTPIDNAKITNTKRAVRPFRVMSPIQDEPEDVITYKCDHCYEMTGRPEVECSLQGTWGAFPTCSRITCQRRPIPRSAILRRGDPQIDILCGNKVTFGCPPGYDLIGSPTIECLDTGLWDVDLPECKIRVCPELPDVANADVVDIERALRSDRVMNPIQHEPNDVVTFECDSCYTIIGQDTVKCGLDGRWSRFPRCNIKVCPAPPRRPDTVISSENRTCGTLITYTCVNPECYNRTGENEKICNTDKIWEPEAGPVCTIKTCPDIRAQTPGSVEFSDPKRSCGSNASFECSRCWEIEGPEILTCRPDSSWGTEFPVCWGTVCANPPKPDNGTVHYLYTNCSDVATFSCDVCYRLVGPPTAICGLDGEWTETPTCELMDNIRRCSRPPNVRNALLTLNSTECGAKAIYDCIDENTIMSGDGVGVCMPDGTWTFNGTTSSPSCIVI